MTKKILLFLLLFLLLYPFTKVFAHEGETYTMNMYDDRYEPKNLTIKQNDTVTFVNKGKNPRWPASNIHPTHEIYSAFDPKKEVPPGSSWSFTFDKAGSWRYHDHLLPTVVGTITVETDKDAANTPATQKKEVKKTISFGFFDKIKLTFFKVYYGLFSNRKKAALNKINMHYAAKNEHKMAFYLSLFGSKAVMEDLLADSGGGTLLDCHQEAHKIGRVAYMLFGAEAFKDGTSDCHSGYYHGAMESFLSDKGTANLAQDISSLCKIFTTGFGNFECLHGVGHGVMAYEDYDLPAALSLCKNLADPFATSSCYGGVFMENIVAGEGLGAKSGHETKWLSQDPHFPCNAVGADYSTRFECYQMQTSRMQDLLGQNTHKIAQECQKADSDMIPVCFKSMGRDIAGDTFREPQGIKSGCAAAPKEYQKECIDGALNVIVDFWGERLQDQASNFCRALDSSQKAACYTRLSLRLLDVFSNKDEAKKRCDSFESSYQSECKNILL